MNSAWGVSNFAFTTLGLMRSSPPRLVPLRLVVDRLSIGDWAKQQGWSGEPGQPCKSTDLLSWVYHTRLTCRQQLHLP